MTVKEALYWLDTIPTIGEQVDAIEMAISALSAQRLGRWVPLGCIVFADGKPVYEEWECSECHEEHLGLDDTLTEYCPHCGARMVSEVTE